MPYMSDVIDCRVTRSESRMMALPIACLLHLAGAAVVGVAPEEQAAYTGASTFQCKDGSLTVPIASLNDDFCDCADGSDEPGTSACSNGRFYCANVGHAAKYVQSSRVGDGLCDCCDGSDEGAGVCADDCIAASAAYRIKNAAAIAAAEEGVRKKAELVAEGHALVAEKTQRLAALKVEIADLERTLPDLESKKAVAEESERATQAHMSAAYNAAREKELGIDTLDAAGLRVLVRGALIPPRCCIRVPLLPLTPAHLLHSARTDRRASALQRERRGSADRRARRALASSRSGGFGGGG
jgi:hypothetical protein